MDEEVAGEEGDVVDEDVVELGAVDDFGVVVLDAEE